MNLTNIKIVLLLVFLTQLLSCSDDRDESLHIYDKTVIIYMIAENDLDKYALENIEKMSSGLDSDNKNVIVYIDSKYELPRLIKIQKNKNLTIKYYDEINSATKEVMQERLTEIIEMYPSKSYGLILWSHGTSWWPEGTNLRAFGNENSREIDIIELSDLLPIKFEFILFDACLMGSVEVLFQLKDKAEYIIASPTEIIANGFPYNKIISLLFGDKNNLIVAAEEFYNYYSRLNGAWQSATISVIDTKELDRLAFLINELITTNPLTKWDYKYDEIQYLDLYSNHVAYDLLDFLKKNYPSHALSNIQQQLDRVVLYKAHTTMFLNELYITDFCGLSCYVPNEQNNTLNDFFRLLAWCEKSGFSLLL